MNVEQAEQLVAMLAAAFPHVQLGVATVAVYTRILADCKAEEGAAIVIDWVTKQKKWPTPADLREQIAKVRGENAPDFDQAWREVRASFGAPESRRKPWSHPAIGDAVTAIGIDEIGRSHEPEIMRAQFERYYKSAVARFTPHSTMQMQRSLVDELKQHPDAVNTLKGTARPILGPGKAK